MSGSLLSPTRGNSLFVLSSNHSAMLTNVWVDQTFSSPAAVLKTEVAGWEVEQRGGLWSVQMLLKNNQALVLPIRQKASGEIELRYQPDPEKEPFIYLRNVAK